jgi:uncharacterized membrane protein
MMKKRNKESLIGTAATMLIADVIAREAPKGTLAKKHAGQIALRYALRWRAIDRANQLKKFLVVSGVIGLIVFIASNWQ